MGNARIVAEEKDYLILYKPHRMHGAPLLEGEDDTLLAWCASRYAEVLSVQGKKSVEGGLLHRLDFETEGLMLMARTQQFYDELSREQDQGLFTKDYTAVCTDFRESARLEGFPSPPSWRGETPFALESAFRAWGRGRKAVRPLGLGESGSLYRTEILAVENEAPNLSLPRKRLTVRLTRGFRHQIRCHLAWLGLPIDGDPLYSPSASPDSEHLALTAASISFVDPRTGVRKVYSL